MADEHRANPDDLPLVTLDNNAFIALRQHEPAETAIRELLAMNAAGRIVANVTFSTGFEAQRPGEEMEWGDRVAWLQGLGIPREHVFTHPRSIGFAVPGLPDTPVFDPLMELAFTRRIHAILFPGVPFLWHDYRRRECEKRGLTDLQKQALLELDEQRLGRTRIPPRPTPALDALGDDAREELSRVLQDMHRRWNNAKNDALGFYNHITQAWHTTHPERAAFVTSDRNFFKATKTLALEGLGYRGKILRCGRRTPSPSCARCPPSRSPAEPHARLSPHAIMTALLLLTRGGCSWPRISARRESRGAFMRRWRRARGRGGRGGGERRQA